MKKENALPDQEFVCSHEDVNYIDMARELPPEKPPHEHRGDSWICTKCDWINTVLRKRCRNPVCGELRP